MTRVRQHRRDPNSVVESDSDPMTLSHDGYVASVKRDEEAGIFHGEVINTRDVLTFQGRIFDELRTAFGDTIADYVEWCRERGKEPEQPS